MFRYLTSLFTSKPKVIVILGPTATGKTSLSIEIAKKHQGEIISADSRQVYTGLDIGSAKVTPEEMQNIPHHLLDITSPKNIFTVQEFVELGTTFINQILEKGHVPIICGGTGMYIDSLVYQQSFPKVPPNNSLRQELEKYSAVELFERLQKINPKRTKTIDPHNKVRLIRAIEVTQALGKTPKRTQKNRYKLLFIGLDLEKTQHREIIHKRIIDRFEKQNMLQEAIDLHANGLTYERMESLGLEYRYMSRYLKKEIDYPTMITELTNKTVQFAKRQRTWFKRNKKISWFHPITERKKIDTLVRLFLQN